MPTPRFSGSFKAPICLYELLPYVEEGQLPGKQALNPHHLQLSMLSEPLFWFSVVCQAVTCNCSAAETVLSQLPPKSVLHKSPPVSTMLSNPAGITPHDSGEDSLGSLRHVYRWAPMVLAMICAVLKNQNTSKEAYDKS